MTFFGDGDTLISRVPGDPFPSDTSQSFRFERSKESGRREDAENEAGKRPGTAAIG